MRRRHHPDQIELGFTVEEMTRTPPSDWQPPDLDGLPDRLTGPIGVDLETCDYGLATKKGAGWAWRGGGYVAGYAVSADNFRGYLPVGHATGNLDHDRVRRWLNHVLGDEGQPKVFANAMYDVSWAQNDGVVVRGPIVDVQLVEALLDEYRYEYSLEAIARDRVGRGKDERVLREAAAAYGVDPKSDMWRLPPRYVGPYAEVDAALPVDIWRAQEPLVREQRLERVVRLEHDLLPLYMRMRRRGVRVDVDYAESLRDELEARSRTIQDEIEREVGFRVEIWAARSVARAFDEVGLSYGMTDKTAAPSITQRDLDQCDHRLAKMIRAARQVEKLRTTFVEGQVLGQLHWGRVHGEIHPLKSDDGGTVTGRLSMSNPNLQFIPARTEDGQRIRRCFLPEDGDQFATIDFNQQEVRLLVHYASLVRRDDRPLPGALEARQRYRDDPSTNYHKFAAEITGLAYKAAKIINFAIIYGRGVAETAADLGLTIDETKEVFRRHEEGMPFARALSWVCQDAVRERGYVASLSGRRMRFDLWEPRSWDARDGRMVRIDEARRRWPAEVLSRARIHKALNSVIQPAAADQTKMAMLAVVEAGYGDRLMIQVHDELDASVPDRGVAERIGEVMRDAVGLEVPSMVDVKVGPNWRDVT